MATVSSTDLKFFTNEAGATLYDRFVKTLEYAQYFDVLVGYFRTSGFHRLYEALEQTEKVRVLVGLSVDRRAYQMIELTRDQGAIDFESHQRTREVFIRNLTGEMAQSEDSFAVELSARKFLEFLESGKLELRAYPSRNLHAKVYISRFPDQFVNYGSVITGSSNFSESGLVAQREFNVELKDRSDVAFALEQFEALWADGVDISQEYVDTLRTKTWLSDQITPYQLYLKLLYEYFKEDINLDADVDLFLPDGFMELAYQKQAVVAAKKILDAYGGVFISDVVGLGKTFISAMLLQQLPGRKLIICPPVLADYWKETLLQFYVPGCEVESVGKLDQILERGTDKYSVVLVDEAHRFRNELTQSYEMLHQICRGKKVILVSATPLNNKLQDILSQLKLFQPGKQSTIPGARNLEAFFRTLEKKLEGVDKDDPMYLELIEETSQKVRDKVLKHVMVRRTRTEVKKYFGDDLERQGLHFPELADPHRIVYEFDESTERVFTDTIGLLKSFTYARYTPLLYLKADVGEFERQSQRNIGGFMKGLLVKRLESSFYAFKQTVDRFITSYKHFIKMYEAGTVYISKKVNVYDRLASDDEDRLLELVEQDKVQKYPSKGFKPEFKTRLLSDLVLLETIQQMWRRIDADPKLAAFRHELTTNPLLKGNKLIVFSESRETADYLADKLEASFPREVFLYSSSGGTYGGETMSVSTARKFIQNSYDPNAESSEGDIRILITTDVLAEGINLHRANIVINYDLPWNPTRVLQRVGRVNRVGTQHPTVHVFNFFPTSQSDEHLGLEGNIKAKIQAFHDTLGEDAKYLSDEEEVSTHELFGDRYAETLYRKLNDKATLEDEAGEVSDLKYLKHIRDIRDEQPELFEEIKHLPQKARSGRTWRGGNASGEGLITFFRKGRLKKFVLGHGESESEELTFLDAASIFECKSETPRLELPRQYYDMLEHNKETFRVITSEDPAEAASGGGGRTNETFILTVLKSKEMRHFKGFTDEDEAYLKIVREALAAGTVPKNTAKRLKNDLKGNLQPLRVLALLRKNLDASQLKQADSETQDSHPREVILSEYLGQEGGAPGGDPA